MTKSVKSNVLTGRAELQTAIVGDMHLVVVLVDHSIDPDVARQLVQQQIMNGGMNLGIQFPKATVLRSWHGGGEHSKERIKAVDFYYPKPPIGVKRIYRCLDVDHRFNWVSDAGLMAMGSKLAGTSSQDTKGEWNIICQSGADFSDSDTIRVLLKLRDLAKRSGHHVMVIVGGVAKLDEVTHKLSPLCDEVIAVNHCDPDPGVHLAMEIVVPSLHSSHQFGVGQVMASVVRTAVNFKIRYEPFVHCGLAYRLAWRLSSASRSLEDIGQVLNKNKSTIMRWLRRLPPTGQTKISEAEVGAMLAMIGCLENEDDEDYDGTEVPRTTAADRKANTKKVVADDDDELEQLDDDEDD